MCRRQELRNKAGVCPPKLDSLRLVPLCPVFQFFQLSLGFRKPIPQFGNEFTRPVFLGVCRRLRHGGRVDPPRARLCRAVLWLSKNPYQFSKSDTLFLSVLVNLALVYSVLANLGQLAADGSAAHSE